MRDFDFSHEKQWYVNSATTVPPYLPYNNNIEVNNGTLKLISRKQTVTGEYVNWDLPGYPVVSGQ